MSGVYIIESLSREDEKDKLFEGEILTRMLKLLDVEVEYVYIRTKKELKNIIKDFEKSDYEYLHFSCHGNENGISLTYDKIITFEELDKMFEYDYSEVKKRLFFSSCSVMQADISKALKETGFLSIIGPLEEISFQDATIFWSGFYHLVFREVAFSENIRMTNKDINYALNKLSETFNLKMGAHFRNKKCSTGYRKAQFGNQEFKENKMELKNI